MRKNEFWGMQPTAEIRIRVKEVTVEGKGVILLTGPSSCGKGEIAKALRDFLSLPEEMHLSMGDILRETIERARKNSDGFMYQLSAKYGISHEIPISSPNENSADVVRKAKRYRVELERFFDGKPFEDISQLDWLEYCVKKGLLIPDEWSIRILDAKLETTKDLRSGIFILDGYPRTIGAAEALLKTFKKLDIGVIKVLHLWISKDEMMQRAKDRNRPDDTDEALERRYSFYTENVVPCIDYLKDCLDDPSKVTLIDAHQPVWDKSKNIIIDESINNIIRCAMQELGLPKYLLEM